MWGDENMDLEERIDLRRPTLLFNNSKTIETTTFSNHSIIVTPKTSIDEKKIISKREHNEAPSRDKKIISKI